MKNASRNKFLLCFRPVVDMDQLVLEPKGDIVQSKNRALACASMDRKEIFERSMSNSSLSDYPTSSGLILQSAKKNISQSMRVSGRESLCEEHPKISKRSFSARRKKSFDMTKDFSVKKARKTRDFTTNSVLSPSPSSESSSPSGSSPLSDPNQERGVKTKNMKSEKKTENLDRTGLYLVLISLAVTVFWGKAFAIIFTSLWLYFLPRRHAKNSVCRPEHVARVPDGKEYKENKKRVIIEGLLERNHQQASHRWGGSIKDLT